ncbi:hypothetical protein WJX72_005180 [[Myrmecia] bisecta]|uniref:Phosphoribulokinase/uridine kinase domain-containing protein n=1 Tax=[Myrmecia] bisecta TaxID=41462 RepID=A0AAW1R6N4_9CHLO
MAPLDAYASRNGRLVAGRGLHALPAEQLSTVSAHLEEYIMAGPLLQTCGLSQQEVREGLRFWVELGDVLISNLGFPGRDKLNEIQRMRIYHYYLPVYFWCRKQLERHRRDDPTGRPLVIGMSAPQGCGKTTLVEELQALFAYTEDRAAVFSVDDCYLTFQEQQALAVNSNGNRLLELRGNAGSHDLQLGSDTLLALQETTSADKQVTLPRYDKSKHQGRGDRADPAVWPTLKGPISVVLFEGWMLGFAPVSQEAAAQVDPDLVAVNEYLAGYREQWDRFVDSWLVVKVDDPQNVYQWRLQAEAMMKASGKAGMSEAQVADFVDRYMPAYKAYLPGLYTKGPTTAQPGKLLVVAVDRNRGLVPQQPPPIM